MTKKDKPENSSLNDTSQIKAAKRLAEEIFEFWDLEQVNKAKPLSINVIKPEKKGFGENKPIEKDDEDG